MNPEYNRDPALLVLDGLSAIEESLEERHKENTVKPSELQAIFEQMMTTLNTKDEIRRMIPTTPQPLDPFVGADIAFERDVKLGERKRHLHELTCTFDSAPTLSDVPKETLEYAKRLFLENIARQCALMFPYAYRGVRVVNADEAMRGIRFLNRCLGALAALRRLDGPLEMLYPFDY